MDLNDDSKMIWGGRESWQVLIDPFERLETKNCIFIDNVESESVDNLIIKNMPEILKHDYFVANPVSDGYRTMFLKAKESLKETEDNPVVFGEINVHDKKFFIYSLSKEYVIFESANPNDSYFIFNRFDK